MNKISLAWTKILVKDVASDDAATFNGVCKFINDPEFREILTKAGCPENIINAIKETVDLSYVERVYCCKKILAEVKKIPALGED